MRNVFAAVFLTLALGILFAMWIPEVGVIAAIAIMGGFILSKLQKKKK